MKLLLFYSSVFICLHLFSTPIQAQPERISKWSAGIVFSPDYAYRTLSTDGTGNGWKEMFDELETPKFGYTGGISIMYMLHRNMEIESGMLYSNKGLKMNLSNYTHWSEVDKEVPEKINTIDNYRYLIVPYKINWFLLHKKARLFLSAGMSADFFLNEFTLQEIVFPDRTEKGRFNQKDTDFNSVIFSIMGGAGIEYPLTNRFFIRLNPEFRYGITPIADTPGKRYSWSVGLNTGFYFRLRHKGNIIFAQ